MSNELKKLLRRRAVTYAVIALVSLVSNLLWFGELRTFFWFMGALFVVFVLTSLHEYIDDRQKQRERAR